MEVEGTWCEGEKSSGGETMLGGGGISGCEGE